jgi:integrase
MATIRLTPRGVEALSTEQVQEEFWDDVQKGLALRVGRGGSKTYIVRYRANGKHRRLKLGTHPHLTLADARKRARKKIEEAQGGEDPALAKKTSRSADVTFKALADEALEAKDATTREKTRRERRRIVDTELIPHWGSRPAASITRRDVVLLVERIALRGAPVMAARTLGCIKVIFNDGLKRGFPTVEANPAHLVEPPQEEARRRRYLDRAEIRAVWKATGWEAPLARVLFRLTLLTGQRVGSIMAMRWDQIDESDVWRIPAESFKGRRPHWVPLSAEALAVLAELRDLTGDGEYAFPGRTDGKHPHMTSANKALQRIRKRTEIPAWTIHDYRRTFRTHAVRKRRPEHKSDPAGLGVEPHVADAVLGHLEASLGFDRYTAEPERYLLSEKREALKRWGAFVLAAVTQPEGGTP